MTRRNRTSARPPVDAATARGVRATYLVFAGSGFGFASWASRIPQVKMSLGLSSGQLGLLLLAIAVGSVLALPLAGPLVTALGSRRTVRAMVVLFGAGLTVLALGYHLGVLPAAVGLCAFGFANGAWDVAMNVQGAVVERRLGRSIMPRFHAGYSLGTVGGALIGAGMVALGVPVTVHLLLVVVLIVIVVPLATRGYVPDTDEGGAVEEESRAQGASRALGAWLEPRTLLIGIFVLAFAFAEGTGNDWISLAVIDDYHAPATVGTLSFAFFLAAMTIGRWFGPGLVDRFGRVAMVRALAVVGVVGVGVFAFGGSSPVAVLGVLLWGLGASLGFPIGMSAGADDPRRAAARVSVIASVGYCAFLGGPPLIGFLADEVTTLKAVLAVAVLLGVSAMLAASVRPPAGSESPDRPTEADVAR